MTRSSGWSAIVVARGPNFFSFALRKAGGWIVSRRLRTAWMEGMLTLRRRRRGPLAVEGAALVLSVQLQSCRHACVTACCCPSDRARHTAGASAAARKPSAEALPHGQFHGLKRRHGGPLQACGRGHASRATPSRGLASRRLAEALASAAQRAWQRRRAAPRGAVGGLPGGRDPTPTFVATTSRQLA